ncbi:uncharacterized protein LOC143225374 isoform X1 [Tachypleus tridentatus]|uniref:uncharacterized protein LOC143225374 isoform X1 n=2 Tax=Tachypleus tridentatus TaxID=6853 RepID=UPI003FD44BA1
MTHTLENPELELMFIIKMDICSLPTEIQERILSFLDGQSLARVQQVCHLWFHLVQNLSEVGEIWKNCCFREIAIDVLRELVGCKEVTNKCGFPVHEKSLNVNWKSSYQRWFTGGAISHWPYWIKSFPYFDSIPITCVKFAGSCIITGHRNGNICAWNSLSGELENLITNHLALVTDIELVDILNRGPYNLGEERLTHHHVISVSKDRTIHVCPIKEYNNGTESNKVIIYQHSNILETVRVFGECFAVNCIDSTMSVWHMAAPSDPFGMMTVSLRVVVHCPIQIKWMGFWRDQIICFCPDGSRRLFSLEEEDWLLTSTNSPNFSYLINIAFKKGSIMVWLLFTLTC